MEFSQKFVKAQLQHLKPFLTNSSIEAARKAQDMVGALMCAAYRQKVHVEPLEDFSFPVCEITPKDHAKPGVLLYLHGGGYVCGDLEYAKGFGSVLAARCGLTVCCPAYRLAPEFPFPAALEDALACYQLLLTRWAPHQILFCGESAGGGLIYALCLKAKSLSLPLPAGLIGISPWTDLLASGASYKENRDADPSMSQSLLQFYAACYTSHPADPLCSPLLGDLNGLPRSLLFAGSDEIMRDDAAALHARLQASGVPSELVIGPGLWHAYVLYALKERRCDLEQIARFAEEVLACPAD